VAAAVGVPSAALRRRSLQWLLQPPLVAMPLAAAAVAALTAVAAVAVAAAMADAAAAAAAAAVAAAAACSQLFLCRQTPPLCACQMSCYAVRGSTHARRR